MLGKDLIINNDEVMPKDLKCPIALIGYGLSGQASLRLLLALGYNKEEIIIYDEQSRSAEFTDLSDFIQKTKPQTLIVSPGFPLSNPGFLIAKKLGLAITSEISLACGYLTKEKLIGITGSMGKSTTTALLNWAIQKSGLASLALGNIGQPLADYVSSIIEKKQSPMDWIVLELSSYQLENCSGLNLQAAAITAFEKNHLDRYKDLNDYYSTKLQIINYLQGPLVLNEHSPDLVHYKKQIQDFGHKPVHWSNDHDPLVTKYSLCENLLLGQHQIQNLTLSAKLLHECGLDGAISFLKTFTGLHHRLEIVHTKNESLIINDSKATSIQSVISAIESVIEKFPNTKKIYLLLGGKDKGLPWEDLKILKNDKFKKISVCFFGQCGEMAQKKSGLNGDIYKTLKECVDKIKNQFSENEIVLLSPGGTSQDEFKNFEERGNFFKNIFTETH